MLTKEQKNHRLFAILAFILIFITLIFINFFNNNFFGFARLDLTYNKMFTLSPGTKNILKKIDEPVILKLFFSKQLAKDNPFFLSFASRVEEFLKLYQRYSGQKIKLQIIDPAPFTEYEDQAVFYGLQGVPVNNEGSDLYFGLVAVNSTTGKEVIPFLQPSREGYLEYDVSQLIYKLTNQFTNKVAVISGLPIQGESGMEMITSKARPWLIWQQIQEHFDAKILSSDKPIEKIPEDTKVLLLINPSDEIPLKTATAVDKFVMQGGRVLLFLDPLSETQISEHVDKKKENSFKSEETIPIQTLLKAWGVDYDSDKVVASRSMAKQVRYNNSEGKDTLGLYPLWLDVGPSSFAKEDVTTANLNKLTFATTGNITANDKSTNTFTPLVTISDVMLINKEEVTKYKNNPLNLLKEYHSQNKPAVLAARITGEVGSAFSKKTAQANIVIVANADLLYDHFWATTQSFLGNQMIVPNSGNANFVLNLLDNLTGSDGLISIRNKDSYIRGFDKIKEIELNSQYKFQEAEAALLKRISDTKQKISSMEQNKLSIEHKLEEESFRKDLINTRKQLREVRRSLREDIQLLENKIKFYTVLFIPSLILTFFIAFSLFGVKIPRGLIRYKIYEQKYKQI